MFGEGRGCGGGRAVGGQLEEGAHGAPHTAVSVHVVYDGAVAGGGRGVRPPAPAAPSGHGGQFDALEGPQ